MLTLKMAAVREPGIFSVQSREFNGFQYGDLKNAPGEIVDELYADNGKVEFIFDRKDPRTMSISQSDITRVIQTTTQRSAKALPAIAEKGK